jgi:hypothetical protein
VSTISSNAACAAEGASESLPVMTMPPRTSTAMIAQVTSTPAVTGTAPRPRWKRATLVSGEVMA